VAEEPTPADDTPQLPAPEERMKVVQVAGPHPATIDPQRLLDVCELRTQRRGGPGGQHRNKTCSGVFLFHEPTNVVGEATERRSQADNREIALQRLRYRLAVEVRTQSRFDRSLELEPPEELALREQYQGTALKIAERNDAKPGVIALLLNDLHAAGGQPRAVSALWQTSTSAIVRLIQSHSPAFVFLNEIRGHHGRGPLK
jgi:RF-1 domain